MTEIQNDALYSEGRKQGEQNAAEILEAASGKEAERAAELIELSLLKHEANFRKGYLDGLWGALKVGDNEVDAKILAQIQQLIEERKKEIQRQVDIGGEGAQTFTEDDFQMHYGSEGIKKTESKPFTEQVHDAVTVANTLAYPMTPDVRLLLEEYLDARMDHIARHADANKYHFGNAMDHMEKSLAASKRVRENESLQTKKDISDSVGNDETDTDDELDHAEPDEETVEQYYDGFQELVDIPTKAAVDSMAAVRDVIDSLKRLSDLEEELGDDENLSLADRRAKEKELEQGIAKLKRDLEKLPIIKSPKNQTFINRVQEEISGFEGSLFQSRQIQVKNEVQNTPEPSPFPPKMSKEEAAITPVRTGSEVSTPPEKNADLTPKPEKKKAKNITHADPWKPVKPDVDTTTAKARVHGMVHGSNSMWGMAFSAMSNGARDLSKPTSPAASKPDAPKDVNKAKESPKAPEAKKDAPADSKPKTEEKGAKAAHADEKKKAH